MSDPNPKEGMVPGEPPITPPPAKKDGVAPGNPPKPAPPAKKASTGTGATPPVAHDGNQNAILRIGLLAFGFILLAVVLLALMMSDSSGPNPIVVMETSMGRVKIEVFQDKAPISAENFLKYIEKKHYDGTIFHRVISTFMIQGGGFEPEMRERPGMRPIRNESYNGLKNTRGTLAMARTGDPDSATAQFFINVVDNKFLDKANAQDKVGYAVFGKVLEGMDVVDKIRFVRTENIGQMEGLPVEPVIIKSVRLVESK